MKSLSKLLLTALAVFVLAKFIPGVTLGGYMYAFLVAVLIAILKYTVKPILVLFTLPVTIITFGLFVFVINAFLLLIIDFFVPGFSVTSIWTALLFSILLSVFQSILFGLLPDRKKS